LENMKRYFFIVTLVISIFWFGVSFAQDVDFSILPEKIDDEQIMKDVTAVWDVHNKDIDINDEYDSVWDKYKEIAHDKDGERRTLWDKLASGIINWDTLLDYVVYLIKFLSQLWLLIGAIMIIYAGYMYASSVFSSKEPSTDPIKHAITGIVVISFSYAIMKILTNAFIK